MVAALVVLVGVEAAVVDIEFENIRDLGAVAVELPVVHVLVAGDVDLLEHGWRNVADAGNGRPQAIDVVLGEAHVDAGLGSADLLRSLAGKDTDEVRAPLLKNALNGAAETGAVGQQQDDGRDSPGHADDGDEGAAAVVDHRLPCLAPDIVEHLYS